LTTRLNSSGIFVFWPNHEAIDARAALSAVWVDPTPELITGDIQNIASNSGVKPVKVPGYWYSRPGFKIENGEAPACGEKVLYILHGGGYVIASASPADPLSALPRSLLEYLPGIRRAFALEYRLSVGSPYTPSNPFPAALMDALAGYNYLVKVVGFSPENIVIEGDSAGGNLALALTRYLVDHQGDEMPRLPGSLILMSPWTDLSYSHYTPGSSGLAFSPSDVLGDLREGPIGYARLAFLGPLGPAAAETNPFISPACLYSTMKNVTFRSFPRTFISAGGAEQFLDQIKTLSKLMKRDMGNELVTYCEAPDAPHDFVCLGHEPQREITLREIAEWLAAN
jgi:acetyl esterase/lipase